MHSENVHEILHTLHSINRNVRRFVEKLGISLKIRGGSCFWRTEGYICSRFPREDFCQRKISFDDWGSSVSGQIVRAKRKIEWWAPRKTLRLLPSEARNEGLATPQNCTGHMCLDPLAYDKTPSRRLTALFIVRSCSVNWSLASPLRSTETRNSSRARLQTLKVTNEHDFRSLNSTMNIFKIS